MMSAATPLPGRQATSRSLDLLPQAIALICLIVLWQTIVTGFDLPPIILPGPMAVGQAIVRIRSQLLSAMGLTAAAAVTGLAASTIGGCAVAFLFSTSVLLRRALHPYTITLQTVPVIAIAPLVIIWLGRGFLSIVVIAFVISVFPIITNTTTGLMSPPRDLLDLFRLYRASWLQTLLKLRFPSALPFLLAGMRVSAGIAVVGAIVGEFFVGYQSRKFGLGYLIRQKSELLKTDELFAAVIASMLLGIIVVAIIDWASAKLLARRTR